MNKVVMVCCVRVYMFFQIFIISGLVFSNQPHWFYQIKPMDNEIMGYGVSDSIDEAKYFALREVSEVLHVNINSEYTSTETLNESNAVLSSKSRINAVSGAQLFGAQIVRSEMMGNKWYVAVVYDNSSLSMKIKRVFAAIPEGLVSGYETALSRSPLVRGLNKELGINLSCKLVRKDNLWQLRVVDSLFPLSDREVSQLLHSNNSSVVSIEFSQDNLLSGEPLNFEVIPSRLGYVSVLYVEMTGKVGVILSNNYTDETIVFPNENFDLIAVNQENHDLTEMYIAIWSQDPLNFDYLNRVSSDYLDSGAYSLDFLFSIIDENEYSSSLIRIINQ